MSEIAAGGNGGQNVAVVVKKWTVTGSGVW